MAEPADHAEAMLNPHDRALPPSRLPRRLQQAGLLAFLALMIVASCFALTEHWRRATFTLGSAMLWLVVLRATCDDSVIGLVSVRSRRFDMMFCLGVGGLMLALAVSVDPLT